MGNSYPTETVSWGSLLEWPLAAFPLLFWYIPAEKNIQKLAGNVAKHTQNVTKISVFTQKFYMWKSELKNLYFDLSKRVLAIENGMKWQQYIRSKSKCQEFVQALAGNSF